MGPLSRACKTASHPDQSLLHIATRDVISLAASATLGEAANSMAHRRISSILVSGGKGRYRGIVTERNIVQAAQAGTPANTPIDEVMSAPVITVPDSIDCQEAYLYCLRAGIRHLALVDARGAVSGVVSETDFRRHMSLTALAGRRRVTAVMSRSLLSLPQEASLHEAVALMEEHRDSCVVVVDGDRPVGIVTERDVVRLYAQSTDARTPRLAEIMTRPLLTALVDATVHEAANRMLEAKVRHLVVVDHAGRLAGLVSEHDLTETMALGLIDAELETEREALRTLIDAIPDAIQFKDAQGRWLAYNETAAKAFGLEYVACRGRGDSELAELVPDHCRQVLLARRQADQAALAASGVSRVEETIVAPDGEARICEVIRVPISHAAGEARGLVVIGRDITQRRQAEAELRLAASVFTNTHEGIVITDAAARIVETNAAFSQITGYSRQEVLGRNPSLLKSGHQDQEFYAAMWRSLHQHGYWSGEVWNRHKSGMMYAEHLTISVVRDGAGAVSHYVGVFADITSLKEHERRLERIAHYDALTGVPNRVLLGDRMAQAAAQALRQGSVMAVCYLDLDGFKPVNDTFGHQAGDRLLVEMTRRMKDCLRAGDTVARIGGDEFVLLLLGLNVVEEFQAALDRILAAVARPLTIDGQQVTLSASIGVTLFPDDDADADTLLRHADQAMYQAKEEGKNRYQLFDPKQDRRLRAHRERRQRLAEALQRQEFVLYYQPKVNMSTGEVVGVEALIRWQHPERGLLLPAEFLPATQGCELEVAVGEWVLDTALKQIAAWNAAGLAIGISVNIGADHLLQPDFADRLADLLKRYPGVAAGRLELEILESTAIADTDQASRTLATCRLLGVRVALDDFGTGYSSLTHFRRLPVETLKIDQSFVLGMLDDPEDLGIVESVVHLAEAFNRSVIAEGAETREHCAILARMRCPTGQGFGIARPMPAEQFPDWVAQWRAQRPWEDFAGVRLPRRRKDIVLKIALASHRKWADAVSRYLRDPAGEPEPELDHDKCRFGLWYRGTGTMRYGHLVEFVALAAPHQAVHACAADLVGLVRAGRVAAAVARLCELAAASDQLASHMARLIDTLESQ